MSKRVANTKAKTARNGRGLNLKAKRRRAARKTKQQHETAMGAILKQPPKPPTLMQKVAKFLRPQKHS